MIYFFIVIILLWINEVPAIIKSKNKADIMSYIIMTLITVTVGIYYFASEGDTGFIAKVLTFFKVKY